jgi:IS30 family transposase
VKQSFKKRALTDVAGVIESSPSLKVAAKRLNVHLSTIYRWVKAGNVEAKPRKRWKPSAKCRRAMSEVGGPKDPRWILYDQAGLLRPRQRGLEQ